VNTSATRDAQGATGWCLDREAEGDGYEIACPWPSTPGLAPYWATLVIFHAPGTSVRLGRAEHLADVVAGYAQPPREAGHRAEARLPDPRVSPHRSQSHERRSRDHVSFPDSCFRVGVETLFRLRYQSTVVVIAVASGVPTCPNPIGDWPIKPLMSVWHRAHASNFTRTCPGASYRIRTCQRSVVRRSRFNLRLGRASWPAGWLMAPAQATGTGVGAGASSGFSGAVRRACWKPRPTRPSIRAARTNDAIAPHSIT
jgi:hypothetical protein